MTLGVTRRARSWGCWIAAPSGLSGVDSTARTDLQLVVHMPHPLSHIACRSDSAFRMLAEGPRRAAARLQRRLRQRVGRLLLVRHQQAAEAVPRQHHAAHQRVGPRRGRRLVSAVRCPQPLAPVRLLLRQTQFATCRIVVLMSSNREAFDTVLVLPRSENISGILLMRSSECSAMSCSPKCSSRTGWRT